MTYCRRILAAFVKVVAERDKAVELAIYVFKSRRRLATTRRGGGN